MNPYRPDRHGGRAETERLLDATRIDAAADPEASLGPDTSLDSEASLGLDGTRSDAAVDSEATLDLDATERSGGTVASVAAADPLAGLLAAAAGPVRPAELAGEEAALAAFRAARVAAPAPSVARRPRRRRLTTGALAWIGALAATATAGAAFAAAGLDRAPDPLPPAPSSAPPTGSGPAATPSTPSAPSAPPTRSTPSGPPSSAGTPSAGSTPNGQLHGLCRAWLAKKPEQREKALRTPAFQRLVTAAGGVPAVEAYCQRLVPEAKPSAPARPSPSAAPSAPARPSPPAEPPTLPGSARVTPSHPTGPARN
ncbi:hypothetical protein [Micromonospora sp. NPDC049274]|uniref:hypothetical protein n=1 Tax=Micromonospora sp. NPDC049274 TaxID=3154829 RepID=UPI003414991E